MHSVVSAVLLFGLLWSADARWQLGLKGAFSLAPADRAICLWAECRQSGGGNRLFQVRCQSRQGGTYGCIFKGNPHTCAAYNNGGQTKFYASLAVKAAQNRPDACYFWKLWSETLCPSILMERVQSSQPAVEWCPAGI